MTTQDNFEMLLNGCVCLRAAFCARAEFKAYQWRFISRGHTYLVLAAFYPGVYIATECLLSWSDTAIARWRRKQETKRLLPVDDQPPPQMLRGQKVTSRDSERISRDIRRSTLVLAMAALSFRHLQLQRTFHPFHEQPFEATGKMERLRAALWYMGRNKLSVGIGLMGCYSAYRIYSVAKLVRKKPERIL
ncbi:hypothetical protein PG990_002855 [Apiospora arundinis]